MDARRTDQHLPIGSLLLGLTLLAACEAELPYGGITFDGTFGRPIPVLVRNDLLLLEVEVNNGPPGWFVVDTGAQFVVIDQGLADELGDELPGPLDSLAFGELTFHDVPGAPFDLSGFEAAVGVDLDGLLGESLLEHFTLVIDHHRRQVTLFDGEDETSGGEDLLDDSLVEPESQLMTFSRSYELPLTSASFEGAPRVPVLLDSGASVSVILESTFDALDERRRLNGVGGVGASGSFAVDYSRLCGTTLDDATLDDLLVGVIPDSALADLDLLDPSPAAIMGGSFFREFLTVFDGPGDEVRLYRFSDRSHIDDYEFQQVGFLVGRSPEGGVYVVHLFEGSDAEAQGVLLNDHVVAIDGVQVRPLDDDALEEALRGEVGATLLLDLSRLDSAGHPVEIEAEVEVEDLLPRCDSR